ncbi:CDP-glycerol glycerophosphotransferase, TagB/SpsB family [Anaeromicropila populeti]|uniref:CDP-glycerol glycerophosphotransferase, TagB/SpsB family n=2 Tax=Anaeromicropila populeti TaxID=37658 RepID=A0A1I6HWF8_9FIRM|nr:CDP-glycerol glycerophosphotransferase, TagB/SpsB family [Anaeromicropila populeti]
MGFLKYWAQLFLLPVYGVSFITPRSKKIWLFGSSFGKRFADNPRYLYLYVSQMESCEERPIWISKDKQIVDFLKQNHLEAYTYRSWKGIYYCLRAGVYLFDNYSKDISFWLSGGAKKINLWHGTGNKKINYDNKFDKLRHPKNNWERFKNFLITISNEKPSHYILATSEMMGDIFSSAFAVPRNHIIVDGYPRNDVLFSQCEIKPVYTKKEEAAVSTIRGLKQQGAYIIFYLPTFRDSEKMFFEAMDLVVFNQFLKDNEMVFITKLHPKSKLKEQFEMVSYSNIQNMDTDIDTYSVLGFADMLTTDYSSIHTDFLMLNRPSVLFTYDLDEYSKDTRECYFDYDSYMPELRTYTMKEFMDGIASVRNQDNCESGRVELRSKMFSYVDCKASERLVKKIRRIVEK